VDPALDLPPLNVPALLRAHDLAPRKSLGQNFLIDPAALRRVVEAAQIPPSAAVLEIGAGLGSLTRYLARAAAQVVAVEIDSHLLPVLTEVVGVEANVRVVAGDMLALNPADLIEQDGYWVVANIPYYITSALIRHLLEAPRRPARIVLTVQREVAERITAGPGDLSLLALSVQVYGQPVIAARIPAGAFYPPPKVDSAVLRIDLYPQPVIPAAQIDLFFRLIKAGFSQKRKTLRNTLSGGLRLTPAQAEALLNAAGIDAQRRAETVSLPEWQRLTEIYAAQVAE
jgi:16S rRNA (adenine1518-N6/adenine1519-N6)-dimethyltransferase